MSDHLSYDVGISFLAKDEALAIELRSQLDPPLNVFVYSKQQEAIAGRDGIEAFREVFGERCSLLVVLYRDGWGTTPWTRVEATAIEEVCLESGWDRLLFVRLDQARVPKWVPKPHLYLNFSTFVLRDLVGAIKARLIELDVEIVEPSAAERAAAQVNAKKFDEETRRLLTDNAGEFTRATEELISQIEQNVAQWPSLGGWEAQAGPGALIGGFVVSAGGQTIQLTRKRLYANSARDAYLELTEFATAIPIQKPGMVYHIFEELPRRKTWRIDIRRLPDLGWCWELDGRIGPASATAEAVLRILLDRIDDTKR